MVRHDFHRQDPELVFLRQLLKHFLQVCIHTILKDLLPVLRAPYDVILQGINISPTICKTCKLNIINAILHIYMIPYEALESKNNRIYVLQSGK